MAPLWIGVTVAKRNPKKFLRKRFCFSEFGQPGKNFPFGVFRPYMQAVIVGMSLPNLSE